MLKDIDIKYFSELYYDLLDSYEIKINKNYNFVYEEFLIFLLEDMIKNYKFDSEEKKFRRCLYRHLMCGWYYRLKEPEKDIEFTNKLRIRKLEKINLIDNVKIK